MSNPSKNAPTPLPGMNSGQPASSQPASTPELPEEIRFSGAPGAPPPGLHTREGLPPEAQANDPLDLSNDPPSGLPPGLPPELLAQLPPGAQIMQGAPPNMPNIDDLPDMAAPGGDPSMINQPPQMMSGMPGGGGGGEGGMKQGQPPPGMFPGGIPMGAVKRASRLEDIGKDDGDAGEDAPKISALPYMGRAVKLLTAHMGVVVGSVLLSIFISLLPFVVAASFGPLMEILGGRAAQVASGGTSQAAALSGIWTAEGSLYSKVGAREAGGIEAWLATPMTFMTLFIIWAFSLVMAQILSFARAFINAQLEQRVLTDIRQKVYDHLQSLSLDFFTGGQTGAIMQRVLTEAAGVQRMLTQALLTPLIDVFVLVIALLYLLGLSWQMTIVAFLLAPLAFFMFRFTSNKLQDAAMKMAFSNRDLSAELEETITGISDIQVFNAQEKRSQRFRTASQKAAKATSDMIAWIGLSNGGAQVFIAISTAVVLLVGILFGARFGLTIASIIVFVQFVPNMFDPVQRIITAYTDYQSLVPNVASTYQLLDTKPTVAEKPNAVVLGEVHGHVSFKDVVFGYSPTQKVLNGISFDIREGETIAFVGPIGCGKSTVMNLILRFLDPERGTITLEGKDISDVTLKSLRGQVSKLSQFPFFLKDTIRENVRLGKVDATDQEVEEACKLAHIHDVIVDPQRMPKGYNTIVDVQVPSGGQKRLIALARCLLRQPEVLLLDEPTENLDADQRNRLTRVIREYARDRTCIVISHDMNFIAAVSDRIIVLNGGKVVDTGTHDELVVREGLYQTLYNLKNVDPALLKSRGDGGNGAKPDAVTTAGAPPPGATMGMPPGMM